MGIGNKYLKVCGGLLVAMSCLVFLACFVDAKNSKLSYNEGDIIFQTSKSAQSKAIQAATHCKYSHMGILYKHYDDWLVYEAYGPVISTDVDSWIKRGVGGHFTLKRLKSGSPFSGRYIERLYNEGQRLQGKPYDPYFEFTDDRIYCSELVWKVYKRALGIELCPLRKLSSFDLSSPVVKAKMQERYGARIPLNMKVVPPSEILNSPYLKTIAER